MLCTAILLLVFKGPVMARVSKWLIELAVPIITGGRQDLSLAVASIIRGVETLAGR